MAADRPNKRKRKTPGTSSESGELWLRQRSDARSERRYDPKPGIGVILTMIGGSLAALALGAGAFGQWLRAEADKPHPYAPYLLGAGVGIALAIVLFGQWGARPIRVGDAGVAMERGPGEIDRLGWHDVSAVVLGGGALIFRSNAGSVVIPLRAHPEAAARALDEARRRIPARVEDIRDDALPRPSGDAGQVVSLEPPQVAGLHCKASEQAITFERDARLCGRCGEVYHKDGVPRRCVTCDAPLRA